MGLASALSTALTGLTAAETQIDVVGNNLANSQTVGFKASEAVFATQFLQTLGLGSAPTSNSGGTNPRQKGLGTQVAEITPDFTQGTVEISSSPSDLAIQGQGFFIVQGATGEQQFTRNGIFKTNSDNELVSVTGQRVLGFAVDDNFQIQTTRLVPLTIPLGSASVAQQTQNVFMDGTLTASGDIADTAEVIESAALGDASVPRPDASGMTVTTSASPNETLVGVNHLEGAGGTHAEGNTLRYRLTFVDNTGTEGPPSDEISVTIPAVNGLADNSIELTNLPSAPGYSQINVYRTAPGGSDFFLLDSVAAGAPSYVDDNSISLSSTPLDDSTINGNYSYLITYYAAGQEESRPSLLIGPQNVIDGRVQLQNLPTPPAPPPEGGFPAYNQIRIYRNLATDSSTFYLVDTVNAGDSYTDSRSDAEISDLSNPSNKVIDLDGPKVDSNTLLTNVLRRDDLNYEPLFREGTLSFTGQKGGRTLADQQFEITSTTTVREWLDFLEDSVGIQVGADDPQNPIPPSVNRIPGETTPLAPGATITDGKVRFVSNNGVDNAVDIGISAFTITDSGGNTSSPNLGFGTVQEAVGQSAVTDFLVYDSLGTSVNMRVTAVMESRDGTTTTYRWFADSSDNDPASGNAIDVGNGLIVFDGEGNVITTTNTTASVERRNTPASSPLEFDFDFSNLRGLAADSASLAASRQDGSPPGTLTAFSIGENGVLRGVFNNGVVRDLGQIRLARFTNPAGLEQRGQNLFSAGANSGLPVHGDPGEDGMGQIIPGALELSNTDIGQNLINLVLASTQYRGNTRVITTAQQLLDELLNLRR